MLLPLTSHVKNTAAGGMGHESGFQPKDKRMVGNGSQRWKFRLSFNCTNECGDGGESLAEAMGPIPVQANQKEGKCVHGRMSEPVFFG